MEWGTRVKKLSDIKEAGNLTVSPTYPFQLSRHCRYVIMFRERREIVFLVCVYCMNSDTNTMGGGLGP